EVAPDVPEQLADVVMKLIAKQPEDRYQSTDEVLCDLHNLRLKPQATSCSSQISIIEAPRFYTTPEIPHNLSRLTGKNWFGRLRNRITDFFGNYAPQVVEYMQTTTQQVDGAVAEYQRRRDKLAQLAKEAKAAAMEFEAQAKASRKAAQVAGERAEVAKSTTAKQQALKEKQENEQTAAELAQFAAEQAEQSEEISLRLAKLNAKLVQLRSQRDALNARMNAARVYMGKEDILLAKRKRRRIIVYAVFVMLVFSFSATLIYMLFGGRAGIPVGKWESVDFVKEIKYFKPGEKQWTGNLHLKGLTFYKDGKTSGPWTWEKGWLWHPEDKTKARFFIKQIGGSSYLFMEWMSGDVTIRGQKPSYYVLQKASDVVAYIVSFKSIHPFETRTAKELLNTFNNRHTQGTRTHHFRTEIKNGKLIGHICVDDEFSKATLAKLLEKNDKLMLVGTRAVNQQEFEEHCRLGQPSLPPLGGSQIDSGLIAHWKFDEGSGNTAHASAGNNHGTIYGATWTAGQVGDALSFDGDGDYVNIKSSNALSGITDNFTISLWARPLETHQIDTESNASWPGSAGQRYALMPVHGDGMWGAGHVGAGISIGTNGVSVYEHTDRYMPPMLVWQGSINKLEHITVVYDNKQPKLYINGTLKRTGIKSGKIVHALPSTIGGASSGYFKGVIDEVRIYSRALSAQEIQQLYRSRTVAPSFGSNIIIPGVGIGDFRLGMSKEDVIKAMGTPKRIFNVFMIFDDISFGITNDVVRSITALGPSYKFANELTVGDPQQKVIETFGNDYELEHFDFKDFMRYKDKGLVFEIRNDNKTVMEIEVISKPGTSNHYMALREAAENGHSQTVETLINEGADVNTKYDSEYTPLHLAAKNGHIETCLKLISKGANINAASVFGETPLHLAAKNGHQQTVQAIIDEGANVNAETKSGKTPLQLAKENGHSQTAHVLIASEVKTSRPEGWFSTLQSKEWWRRTMEFFILFGLMALVFISPIFAYALIFKSVGIITRNSKCSYLRSLLISFIFLLVIFGIHCLAVALRRTALIHSDNLIYLIVEWGLAIGCGTMLFKKTLSIKPVFSIILSTEIFFAQLWVVVFVIGNMFRM
ncbi:MAG: ankyrin repeat domain-containing protein, partial [Planctomycetes bacterium]|nr:ankyrin repeat domain-containing protein [Planctomycetota bacterium]